MARKRKVPGHFYCPTWMMNYYFFIGWKWQDFLDFLLREYGYELVREEPGGYTLMLEKGSMARIFIWTHRKHDYSVLAHECVHGASMTLSNRGVKSSFDNDEPQAYLVGSIMLHAMETMK